MSKPLSYYEDLMLKAYYDDQNGIESDLAREVRLSLEESEKRGPERFYGPPRPIGPRPMKAKRKLTPN
jgi:hypothetical protein